MSYNAFLLVMSQLAGSKKARIVIQDNTIYFEKSPQKNRLILTTLVFSGEGFVPHSVRDAVSSRGSLHWQTAGSYLKLDLASHCVFLCEEIEIEEGKYLPFRHHLSAFSDAASEWKKFLNAIAEDDYSRKTL